MRRTSRRPQAQALSRVFAPAPVGGINTVSPIASMPDEDAVYLYNLLSSEYGLRSRLGSREWCTGLTGQVDNLVRSMVPFVGGHASGTTNRLFANTSKGIWDVSASSSAPTKVFDFASTANDAGLGCSTACTTSAGKFLLYCDEENGYHVYSEGAGTWAAIAAGVTQPWAPITTYQVGNKVLNGGNTYTCTTGGVSANNSGPAGTGAGIADSSVVWTGALGGGGNVIGTSLGDQQSGLTADPTKFAFVVVWKHYVFFVEKDSTRVWYLATNSIYGTATSFDFGAQMRSGGALAGLYTWSYNAGNGMDSMLVAISGAGDVVIYQGTDPNSSNTFGLVGSWFLGGVPAGRRIATDFGGDILVMSLRGIVPLSKLVRGESIEDVSLYATQKVANLFNRLVSQYGGTKGWALHVHPTDNALLALVSQGDAVATSQLAMSFATRGWSIYRDLPMYSAGVWSGQLYFGTPDGRVLLNTGYVDGVTLADPNSFSPVAWSLLSAFRNEDGRAKRVQMLRPSVMSEGAVPAVQATAKYGFDISEPPPPAGSVVSDGSATWDHATWDADVWGGDYSSLQPLSGATGIGRDVAIAMRGSAIARTVIVGCEVLFDEGGYL